jgi:hypothetical protein
MEIGSLANDSAALPVARRGALFGGKKKKVDAKRKKQGGIIVSPECVLSLTEGQFLSLQDLLC